MKRVFYILIFVFIFFADVRSQVYFNYNYEFNSSISNASSVLEIDSINGYVFPACIYGSGYGSILINRVNINGDTLWTKEYKKYNASFSPGASNSIIKTLDSNFVFCGSILDSVGNRNAFFAKLNFDGDTLWTKNYGGSGFDNANVVCQTPDSGFVLMGVTQSFSMGPASDFYMIKIDKDGLFQWQKVYGTTLAEDCLSGQITLDGGFILAGHRNNQLHIVKTDNLGNFAWERVYSGTAGQGYIKQLPDSTYILVGAKSVSGLGDQAYVSKLTKTGVVIWSQTYGGAGNQQLYAVPIIIEDGSIVCSGVSTLGVPWGLLLKTDSLGNGKWLRSFYKDPAKDNYFYDVKHTSDNGFVMSGFGLVATSDPWLVKVDSNGCEIVNCNVGLEELPITNVELKVYPNPSTSEINISIDGDDLSSYELAIQNLLGQEQKVQFYNSKANIQRLSTGIYFITAISKDGKQRITQKFVKL